jgi:hypothetical protein
MTTIEEIHHRGIGRQHVRVDHKGQNNTKTNTYLTPIPLLEVMYECLERVGLDPSSNSQIAPQVVASRYHTEREGGLTLPWNGRIFCNPPIKPLKNGHTNI